MEQKKIFYTKNADGNQSVKPQVNGQRVTFDKGKLVVMTNRGRLDAKGNAEVPLEGIFTINAVDLAKILSVLTDMKYVEEDFLLTRDHTFLRFFNPTEDVLRIQNELKQVQKESNDYYSSYLAKVRENNTLRFAIKEFNETRKWWERKFVIPKIDENGETDDNTD